MNDRILIIDWDGIIFNSLKLIDSEVQKIEPRATDAYLQQLITLSEKMHKDLHQLEYERANEDDEQKKNIAAEITILKKLRNEHFDLKDQVLEEVYPEYQGKIDYFNIYQLCNTYPRVISTIWKIWESGVYTRIICATHYNSENEKMAKEAFRREYLPMMEFVPIKFHLTPYFNPITGIKNVKRLRTNKIEYLKKRMILGDLSQVTFIDDSLSIVNEAEKAGIGYAYYKDSFDNVIDVLEKAFFETCMSIGDEQRKVLKMEK